ncbi:MAG TPA: HU family DNA-binding protein [Candidatus Kapabacteria bacterium]|nr:HU family DNA-binding protein [Candidatus Kapabacteria bacterium]
MNKTDLVNHVAEVADLTKVNAEKAIKATFEAVSTALKNGDSVTLIGFGTFSVMEKQARTGKNPRTGETIEIPARKTAKFKAGKTLKDLVNPVVEAPKKKGKKK